MKTTMILVLLVTLSGCMTTLNEFAKLPGAPGYITEHVSQFDGGRELVMEPGWTEGESVRLGLFWRSTMPEDEVRISAQLSGAHNLGTLSLNIDGDIQHFEPIDALTHIRTEPGDRYWGPTNWSKREYRINRQLVERMLAARRVAVRVDTLHGYAEGIFSTDLPTAARPAFRTFHAQVWGDNQAMK